MDGVINEPEKAVDKVVPGSRIMVQAAM